MRPRVRSGGAWPLVVEHKVRWGSGAALQQRDVPLLAPTLCFPDALPLVSLSLGSRDEAAASTADGGFSSLSGSPAEIGDAFTKLGGRGIALRIISTEANTSRDREHVSALVAHLSRTGHLVALVADPLADTAWISTTIPRLKIAQVEFWAIVPLECSISQASAASSNAPFSRILLTGTPAATPDLLVAGARQLQMQGKAPTNDARHGEALQSTQRLADAVAAVTASMSTPGGAFVPTAAAAARPHGHHVTPRSGPAPLVVDALSFAGAYDWTDGPRCRAFSGAAKRIGLFGCVLWAESARRTPAAAEAVVQIFRAPRRSHAEVGGAATSVEHAAAMQPAEILALGNASMRSWRGGRAGADAVLPAKVGKHEIYAAFPSEYDRLMERHNCELVAQRIADVLAQVRGPSGRPLSVCDIGAGTGRIGCMLLAHPCVERLYACDSEPAMLARLVGNLRRAARAIAPQRAIRVVGIPDQDESSQAASGDATMPDEPPPLTVSLHAISFSHMCAGALERTAPPLRGACNIAVCAWSLSHANRGDWGTEGSTATLRRTLLAVESALDRRSRCAVVIVETLGHSSTTPRRRTPLHEFLENSGYQMQWCRTDYTFASPSEARELCTFFFGRAVGERVSSGAGTENAEGIVLHECSGVWTKLFEPEGRD